MLLLVGPRLFNGLVDLLQHTRHVGCLALGVELLVILHQFVLVCHILSSDKVGQLIILTVVLLVLLSVVELETSIIINVSPKL